MAEGYLKRCNAIWIVSPIIRAVNEEAAKARPLPAALMTLSKNICHKLAGSLGVQGCSSAATSSWLMSSSKMWVRS